MGGFNWLQLTSGNDNRGRLSSSNVLVNMPPELLACIFSFLPGKDVSSAARVCKSFYSASKIESIWQNLCAQEYGVSLQDNPKKLSYMHLYTKVLYKYGHLIGLWRTEVSSYGGLLQVKFEDSRLVGLEWHPPSNPNLRDALRRRSLFTIELLADGTVQILCQKGNRGPHPAAIEMVENKKKNGFYSKCLCPDRHEYLLGKQEQEFSEWLKSETNVMHLLDDHMKELFLVKFLIIREYERNAFEHKRLDSFRPVPGAIIQPGLFKGTYSAHGLELVLLSYDPYGTKVFARKVTGDPNVPAGKITFKSDLQYPIILTEMQQLDAQQMQQPEAVASPIPMDQLPLQPFRVPADFMSRDEAALVPNTCKARFYGFGQVAGHGFTNPSFIGGHWIIFNEDLFGFLWFELLSLSLYHRVKEDFPCGV